MQVKTKLKEILNGRPHAFEEFAGIDFYSGLGDGAWLLYGLCRAMKPRICVEVGSARGKSTCSIGMALKENGAGHLFAIDPHTRTNWNDFGSVDTYEIMQRNLARLKVQDFVTVIRKTSAEVLQDWDKKIDLIFIDGDHSYEGVKADWEGFRPFLSEFGLVIFHDTLWDLRPEPTLYRSDMGVPRFVDELRQQGFPTLTIDKDFGISIVQAVPNGNSLGREDIP